MSIDDVIVKKIKDIMQYFIIFFVIYYVDFKFIKKENQPFKASIGSAIYIAFFIICTNIYYDAANGDLLFLIIFSLGSYYLTPLYNKAKFSKHELIKKTLFMTIFMFIILKISDKLFFRLTL